METDQRASEDGKQVNGVVINGKIWTRDHGFTSGVMHIKCIHELCIIILIFKSYLHHIRVIS